MNLTKIQKPLTLIIFGASGDLAKIKIFPSLYDLALQKRFPAFFNIVGYSRTAKTDEEFKKEIQTSVETVYGKNVNHKILKNLLTHVSYVTGQYDHADDFKKLAKQVITLNKGKKHTVLAYFSVPPEIFEPVIEGLAGIQSDLGRDLHLILEKPFGRDEASATRLFHFIARFFSEDQIYLLDHYLGKEAVQSIFRLRYSNSILDRILDPSAIQNIQITAAEEAGVGHRIGYFEQAGIIRDMVQSHLLQIMSLITMTLPIKPLPDNFQREKYSILAALNMPGDGQNAILGQYKGYALEKGVQKKSTTETFVALRFFIDQAKWFKIPIYIRTGKKLTHKHTYIVIEFKKTRVQKFYGETDCNRMIIELFPEEKFEIHLINQHGEQMNYEKMITQKSLACSGDDCLSPHARLLLHAAIKNRMYFLSFNEILASWRFVEKLFAHIKSSHSPLQPYAHGTNGPDQQNDLTAKDGNEWYHWDPN